jgi:hypothetical protein
MPPKSKKLKKGTCLRYIDGSLVPIPGCDDVQQRPGNRHLTKTVLSNPFTGRKMSVPRVYRAQIAPKAPLPPKKSPKTGVTAEQRKAARRRMRRSREKAKTLGKAPFDRAIALASSRWRGGSGVCPNSRQIERYLKLFGAAPVARNPPNGNEHPVLVFVPHGPRVCRTLPTGKLIAVYVRRGQGHRGNIWLVLERVSPSGRASHTAVDSQYAYRKPRSSTFSLKLPSD